MVIPLWGTPFLEYKRDRFSWMQFHLYYNDVIKTKLNNWQIVIVLKTKEIIKTLSWKYLACSKVGICFVNVLDLIMNDSSICLFHFSSASLNFWAPRPHLSHLYLETFFCSLFVKCLNYFNKYTAPKHITLKLLKRNSGANYT